MATYFAEQDRARMPFVEAFRAARQMVAPMMAPADPEGVRPGGSGSGGGAAATSAADASTDAKPARAAEKSQ